MTDNLELSSRYGMRTEEFSALMQHRVRDILLVASRYDAFALEEDGQLTELVFQEYRNLDLNLRYAPRFARANSAGEALKVLDKRPYDMVVVTPRLPDMELESFVEKMRNAGHEQPIGVLAAHAWELPQLEPLRASGAVDWLFLWQGEVTSLLAMIKQVEDRLNADSDVIEGGVQAVILVEDEVRFYSAYLPHIYTEVTTQTSLLMAEGLNLSHRLLRIRARPKILLAQNYEEAWELFERFSGNLLGVISDVSYPRNGTLDPEAGVRLMRKLRKHDPDLPLLLQSIERKHARAAAEIGAHFLDKKAPNLLEEIRHYIQDHFGFGDFVFRSAEGAEIRRATDLRELLQALAIVPDESLVFHAERNDFSAWLKARTEFELASALKPRKVTEFDSVADLRLYLMTTMTRYLREIQRHVIIDFDGERYDEFVAFAKVGSGSLGGKGRGLAFMHKLLSQARIDSTNLEVVIPQTVVLASDNFELFLEENGLRNLVREIHAMSDPQILDAFRRGRIPAELRQQLACLLQVVTDPLAVRSSSILEDSVYQPFAGVYTTVMLPNNHPSLDIRLAQLIEAIKVVYASTYFSEARAYLESTPYRIEEEYMAVLVQRLVGSQRGELFYPTLSGVASSYNFYPFRDMTPTDGVAQIALGLGKSVVEGFDALRFCPSSPLVLPQFSSVKDILKNAQRRFYAVDLSQKDVIPGLDPDAALVRAEANLAIDGGGAAFALSTYDHADNRISSGYYKGTGTPLITFDPVLRGRPAPLPDTLTELLHRCEDGLGNPVEIEFAMDLRQNATRAHQLNVLQVRPMVVEKISQDVRLEAESAQNALVYSDAALGHGRNEVISDIIMVDPERLDRAITPHIATLIDSWNQLLRKDKRRSVLIGPGRWGSQDPWLGIPVSWPQISAVRAIVETDFSDLEVEPSLGSHFFHNLTCFGVAFFAAHRIRDESFINWDWFRQQQSIEEAFDGVVRHLRLETPISVVVDGSSGRGVILPGCDTPSQ
ncbi:MAG: hypothetical protein GY906_02170 [bacterium]|nr:hypothetical protein [bacterium]